MTDLISSTISKPNFHIIQPNIKNTAQHD